ncbi:hypothetical protein Aperf_G00000127079 [Anoplocephala perfoliata]
MECAPGAGEILAMSSPSPRSCAAVSIEVSSIEPVNSSAKMETVDDTEVGIQVSTAKLEMGASSSGCRSSRISVEDIKESEKSSTPVNGSLLQTEWNISASLSGRRGSRMSVELPQTDSPQGTELPVDVDEQAVGSSPCLSESKEVLKQNPEGHWNRQAVPVGEAIDLSPIKPLPGRRRVFDDYGLSLEEDSVETCKSLTICQ